MRNEGRHCIGCYVVEDVMIDMEEERRKRGIITLTGGVETSVTARVPETWYPWYLDTSHF